MTEPLRADPVVRMMRKWLALTLIAAALPGCLIAAQPPLQSYHAVGTEPFWSLTIRPRDITFTRPDAPAVTQATPKVIVGFAGEIYNTPRIHVNIVHQPCSDGMSDRAYPDKVHVTVDGRTFHGCGGL